MPPFTAVYPWEDIAEGARRVALSSRPWVLVGHTVHRSHAAQIRRGAIPAFVEGRTVKYEVALRCNGDIGSLWVKYVGRKKP